MKDVQQKSILRIRTFGDDIARAKGERVLEAPKVQKTKVTAQELTNTLLKDTIKTHSAEDFIGTTDGEYIPVEQVAKKTPSAAKKKETENRIPPTKKIKTVPPAPPQTNKKEAHKKLNTPPPSEKHQKNIAPKKQLDSLSADIEKITRTEKTADTEAIAFDTTNNSIQDGTLVTNKKSHRFHLLPAIATSIQSWFSSTAEKITTAKEPEETIASAKSRIEIIKEAARTSNHAPANDHGIVIKKIKGNQKGKDTPKSTSSVHIKKKGSVAAPQWASVVEAEPSQGEVLPTPNVQENVPEITPDQTSQPNKEQNPQKTNTTEIPQEKPVLVDSLPPETTPHISTEKETSAPPIPVALEKVETETTSKKKIKPVPPAPKNVSQKKRKYKSTPQTNSGIPIYVYLAVILVASVTGIGVTVYWFTSSTSQTDATIVQIPTLFTADQQIAVALPQSRESLLSTVLEQILTTRETVQVYPTRTNENGMRLPTSAQDTLSVLSWRAPGSFTRAITAVTFGGYNGTSPFMLVRARNFDTAFGGLLQWEPDMSADLAPLFGDPVTQSFDPYARTDTQIRSAFFRDAIISNKSARILVDDQDTERLVYVFVTPQIVLIAPDTPTITAILPLVTQ